MTDFKTFLFDRLFQKYLQYYDTLEDFEVHFDSGEIKVPANDINKLYDEYKTEKAMSITITTGKQTIENCPFCGSEAKLHLDDEQDAYFVECTGCLASSSLMFNSKDDAAPHVREKWNTRVQSLSVVNKAGEKYYKWVSEVLPESKKDGERLPIKYKGVPETLISVNGIWCWDRDNHTDRYSLSKYQLNFVEWLKEIEYLDET